MSRHITTGVRAFLRRLWKQETPPAVLTLEAVDVDMLFRRALEYQQQGALEKAQELYQEVIALESSHFDAWFLSGIVAAQKNDFVEAIKHLRMASKLHPADVDVYCALGDALAALQKYSEAVSNYKHALELAPTNVEARINQAIPLHKLGRDAEALRSLELALRYRPDSVEALVQRGNILSVVGRWQDALASFDHALQIDAQNAGVFNNRGIVLYELGRPREAIDSYNRAIEITPQLHDALINKGLALSELGQYEEAMQCYVRVLDMQQDSPAALYNQSLCSLLAGDFEAGWRQYESRWKIEQFQPFTRDFPWPLWLGKESLAGRTILLHAEQGVGDTIQFCRYVDLVIRLRARVYLEVPQSLGSLLSQLDGIERVLIKGEQLPEIDFHCPLLSLPLVFSTTVDTMPARIPYLYADTIRVSVWRGRLSNQPKPRVGLVWSGNPGHRNDRNRSIPLRMFAPVLTLDCEFISLQKELRESDKVELDKLKKIGHFGDALIDFCETAALIECLDLIISVDTAAAHLAGAMGKPVWILLPFNPDWRWMTSRDDSPWYPTASLFRQRTSGDWQSVLNDVSADLAKMLKH